MIRACGIDPAVLVRLVTGEPEPDFQHCVNELRVLIEEQDAEMFASNQVIGEACIVLQHHYGISASDARAGLVEALTSGMVAPLNGQSVVPARQASDGPGVFDRLIADGYSHGNPEALTLDKQMAGLPHVRRLGTGTSMGS